MNDNLPAFLSALTLLGLLSGCATAPTSSPSEPPSPIAMVEQEIKTLLTDVGNNSGQTHGFEKISHCRYELSTEWQNLEQGYYFAKSAQRISFAYDIRNIENTPAYSLKYHDGMQYWQEMLDLTFNRMVPTHFSYIKTDNYSLHQKDSTSDAFNISGYNSTSRETMQRLLGAFERLAGLCGTDVEKYDDLNQKVLGRWEIFGLERPEGALIITPNQAGLLTGDNQRIEGAYTLTEHQDYALLTILPNDGAAGFNLLLDFVNSNYARILLLGNKQPPVPFAPAWADDEGQYNQAEQKLFRKGDLR